MYEPFTFYSQKVNKKVNFAILIKHCHVNEHHARKKLLGLIQTSILFSISWYGTMFPNKNNQKHNFYSCQLTGIISVFGSSDNTITDTDWSLIEWLHGNTTENGCLIWRAFVVYFEIQVSLDVISVYGIERKKIT